MVLYEVNIMINTTIANNYHAWLTAHIDEMLTLPGFEKAQLFTENCDLLPEKTLADTVRYVVHYQVASLDALQRYFTDYAPAMRDAGIKHWGQQVVIDRRVIVNSD